MIIYFSGTGNSEWVAKQLAALLGERIMPAASVVVEGHTTIALKSHERLGFVFPTYSWGPAPVMLQAIEALTIEGTPSYCFMVTTCGDDIGLSASIFEKALAARHISLSSAFSVQMPNNYVNMKGFDVDSDEVRAAKLRDAGPRVKQIAHAITTGRVVTDVVTGSWAWVKSRIIRPWFLKHAMSDSRFHADASKCTHCGLCERSCPLHNISLTSGGTPTWNHHCAMCLGCLHRCPQKAINYGRATQSKGRYFLKEEWISTPK